MSRIVSDVKMPKLSVCFGFRRRALRSATVASSIAAAICETSLRLDRHRQLRGASRTSSGTARAGSPRTRPASWPRTRAALGADADDAEVHAFDLNDLLERIDVRAEQTVGRAASR